MLLWINGPVGGGKTATAYELNRRLPGSVLCDPEHVGFGMRRMLPAALRGNFQDLPAWRHSVVELLRLTLAAYHVLILGEAHLRAVLAEYQVHYNTARPHQGIAQRVPDGRHDGGHLTVAGLDRRRILRKPVLGGLINEYARAA